MEPAPRSGGAGRDRARSRQKLGGEGLVVVVAGEAGRRSRQGEKRPKVVQFSLTEGEYCEVSEAAARSGLARGAFAAEVTLAAARGEEPKAGSLFREAFSELVSAAGLVRRIGTNLNQAVARLNATGQRGDDLLPAAQFCARVTRRLDSAAEQLRRSIP
jgi:hypothetical protein